MPLSSLTDDRQKRKKRRIRFAILFCLGLLFLLTYLETKVLKIGEVPIPVSGNVLVFILLNISVLLLLLVVFLVLRNLAELLFERKQKILGSRLRTKLVISFISLSLIPTALLFFIALQFVSTSMDYWFNANVEQSLQESLTLAKSVYHEARERVKERAAAVIEPLAAARYRDDDAEAMRLFLDEVLQTRGPDGFEVLTDQRQRLVNVSGAPLAGVALPETPPELLRAALAGGKHQIVIQSVKAGDLVRDVSPVATADDPGTIRYLLVTTLLIPRERIDRMGVITDGLEGYRQLMLLKTPIKTSLLVMLVIVTLLIVFSAIWFGIYIAQGLTGPIGALAAATRRVAEGELDFELVRESDDEMGLLVDSFNRMTRDLLTGKQQLEEANLALKQSNLELDQRGHYTETILRNVAAGVVSFDQTGCITTINRFAEELLRIRREDFLGHRYPEVLHPNHSAIIDGFLQDLEQSGKMSIQRHLRLTVGNEILSLLISITGLQDENGRSLGAVLVFDNLTQLEKAQRVAAWREVARRIAHEVKNPLTPIQLSAQRLRKKYLGVLGEEEGEVLNRCTRTIINQVDELKRLVSEFSGFARMPTMEMARADLTEMVGDVLALYEEGHKNIRFGFRPPVDLPPFNFDLKQMKRVLINLIDNAIAAVGKEGTIEIELRLDREKKTVDLEVRDNGPGVKDVDKTRLFEPYFSTKKSGTGLGLAIANTIVADHGGAIAVRDNQPTGAVFIVELPFVT